jgi:hypothetical protein
MPRFGRPYRNCMSRMGRYACGGLQTAVLPGFHHTAVEDNAVCDQHCCKRHADFRVMKVLRRGI